MKSGHPWVFENSIIKQNKDGSPGDIAIIFDQKANEFLAMGLYDPDSPIRIKILSTTNGDRLTQEWIRQKIQLAFEQRSDLRSQSTNAYRLCFGENDGLPSLICDVYQEVVVVKVYSRIWLAYLEEIKSAIINIVSCSAIVLRLSRSVEKINTDNRYKNGSIIYGQLDSEEVIFKEHGVLFHANVVKGHKTGFFLDHRHNRYTIQKQSKGKSVLDVFSYAGGFAVHALVGGAKEVTAVDISKQALSIARKNAELNKSTLQTIAGDAFTELKRLANENLQYDIVIIDPPAFAKSAKEVSTALNQYKRLAKLGIELTADKGLLLLASCSSRVNLEAFMTAIEKGMATSKKTFTLIDSSLHDIDHPIGFEEGAYLKSAYYRINR